MKVPVAFRDVAACFAEEDWKLLHEGQKVFYRNVVKDIHQVLITLGFKILNTETLLRIIKWEDSNREALEDLKRETDPTDPTSSLHTATGPFPDVFLRIKHEEEQIYRDSRHSEETENPNSLRSENTALNKTANLPENPRKLNIQRKDIHPVKDVQIHAPVLISVPSAKSHIPHMCIKHEDSADDPSNVTKHQSYQVRNNKCKYCSKIFTQHCQLMEHMRIHTEWKSFVFDHIPSIEHQMVHAGEKSYKCTQGSESFSQSCAPKVHQRIHTGKKPYECKDCKKTFTKHFTLKMHQRTHTGEKPYKCTECKKAFSKLSTLKTHQMIHTGEKPYKCTECKKAFSRFSALTLHLRIHTGERPYKCAECKKSFISRTDLCRHEMTHTGEKPYECTECKKAFTQLYALKVHQRLHTGEKPYECTECKKAFTQPIALIRHRKTHTKEKP